ncbi:large conductance mechanosensitive channel [Mycoplasmopsis mustelae]|uniref:Large conductance mechanosensitive channel n=1 Tax=Mycoplasmopsis mustelae TaxID=171289 RepID=A0A4R7UDK9_9BACT|nr:MscL family protein [Mycoplasmopsis mustelae]TDV23046.1 large conductance mechanosensitive channel [Mycoplasmopsis mustelae]
MEEKKPKSLWKETFSEAGKFFKKGNMIFLAIGFITGSVFSALVSSLANDVILSAIIQNILGDKFKDLNDLSWRGIKYGKFLGTLINFIVVTLVIFISLYIFYFVRLYLKKRRLKKHPPEIKIEEPPKPTTDELILEQLKLMNSKIPDTYKQQNNPHIDENKKQE